MKKYLKKIFPQITLLKYIPAILGNPFFIKDYISYNRKVDVSRKLHLGNIFPFVNDKTSITQFDTHYIYHPAWAARTIKTINPNKHIDISSTLHFSTVISAFIPTEFYDYRPAFLNLSGLSSGFADLNRLPFDTGSIESISCMHTIEHIGLGRYGDAIDPEGDMKAIRELIRVVKPYGNLLFVVHVGKPRLLFNAHRIYSFEQIISFFTEMELIEFSLIPDNALEVGLLTDADPELVKYQEYSCGCFWFRKSKNTSPLKNK